MNNAVVIIGGSHAAVAVADGLRKRGHEGAITMVGAEAALPYQRPPLSKAYMSGEMTLDRLHLRPQEWYDDNGIALRLGTRATGINPLEKTVALDTGDKVSYDTLVLATGATPRSLPVDGTDDGKADNVFTVRDLSDADALMGIMMPGTRLAVIGGGYIGLEAAAEASKKGLHVTVIEAAPRILQRVASAETADFFRALHTGHGVEIIEDAGGAKIIGQGTRAQAVELPDGRCIPCDLVIVGIGIVANGELAETARLETERGAIIVDDFARTSDPDIYACGDCTIFNFDGQPTRLESVQNANDQAMAVAANICGEITAYAPTPWFWSDQYDVSLQIAGLNRGYDTVLVRPGKREGALSHFYFAGERFIAADCLNDAATYVACKKILEMGKTLTRAEIADPDFNLKDAIKR